MFHRAGHPQGPGDQRLRARRERRREELAARGARRELREGVPRAQFRQLRNEKKTYLVQSVTSGLGNTFRNCDSSYSDLSIHIEFEPRILSLSILFTLEGSLASYRILSMQSGTNLSTFSKL